MLEIEEVEMNLLEEEVVQEEIEWIEEVEEIEVVEEIEEVEEIEVEEKDQIEEEEKVLGEHLLREDSQLMVIKMEQGFLLKTYQRQLTILI